MKRLVATPREMVELDVAGSERHVFVTVTLFGEDGWATDEQMWTSHQEEGLAMLLTRLNEIPSSEAAAVADDLLAIWRKRVGAAEGASLTGRFGLGMAGILLAVALVAVLLTWAGAEFL